MEENTSMPAESDEGKKGEAPSVYDYAAPGAPIVRGSTPRPLTFLVPSKTDLPLPPSSGRTEFPIEAPDAPPLPEESSQVARAEEEVSETELVARGAANEFVWLFEYALDMDPVRLNRPERLDGSAFAYGPAMLKGYRFSFDGLDARNGHVLASLREARDQAAAEVWGILYRVPRRYTRGEAGEIPFLDKVHGAETFVPVEVQVREPYRQREVTCVTYLASETTRQQVAQLAQEKRQPQPDYLKRLLQVARRQKLPASYVRTLEDLVPPIIPAASPLPTTPPDQDTEPLPAVILSKELLHPAAQLRTSAAGVETERPALTASGERRASPWEVAYPLNMERWLLVFALYVSLLLLGALVLAVYQGLNFWPAVFNEHFLPLGIPWYVLIYSVLGGCISCMISLSRPARRYPPTFVILTWFMRPALAAVLGAFAYLVLNSGLILVSTQPGQHFALCSVVGGLAGLCEGKFVTPQRRNRSHP